MNAIDWLLKVLHDSVKPAYVTGEELIHRVSELRAMSAEISECVMKCPGAKCVYKAFVPREQQNFEIPHICPQCSTPLRLVTWKELAVNSGNLLEQLKADYVEKLKQAVQMVDDLKFMDATNQEELEYLRERVKGPQMWLADRMLTELRNNRHKGDWDAWEPPHHRLIGEILHHTDKLDKACQKNNRYAVDEHAADIANFALKTAQLYGTAPKS